MQSTWASFRSLVYTFLMGVIVGIVLTLFVGIHYSLHWPFDSGNDSAAAPAPEQADTVRAVAVMLDLSPDFIVDEMLRNGRIVRGKTKPASASADAQSDDFIRKAILQRYGDDPVLARVNIRVQSRKGKVSLSGKALAPGYIGRAIAIAYSTEGVLSVSSTIEVKPVKKT